MYGWTLGRELRLFRSPNPANKGWQGGVGQGYSGRRRQREWQKDMAEGDGRRLMATVLKIKGVTLYSKPGFGFIRCHLSGAPF